MVAIDGVNLPRWGLKRVNGEKREETCFSVNLPRWGLKLVAEQPSAGVFVV